MAKDERQKTKDKGEQMIEQTSISYYGLNYVEHAEADFAEMKAHGVT